MNRLMTNNEVYLFSKLLEQFLKSLKTNPSFYLKCDVYNAFMPEHEAERIFDLALEFIRQRGYTVGQKEVNTFNYSDPWEGRCLAKEVRVYIQH